MLEDVGRDVVVVALLITVAALERQRFGVVNVVAKRAREYFVRFWPAALLGIQLVVMDFIAFAALPFLLNFLPHDSLTEQR